MDFQLARNLSALSRAQQEVAQALLHIDSLADCINREIIMSAASSEATEQLVASAKATLLQVQDMLATQSDEGASRLRDAQISFITTRRPCSQVHRRLMSLQLTARYQKRHLSGGQSCVTERNTPSEGHSFAQTAIRGSLWRNDE